jgi:hemoglobin-like flavoprotein
MGENLSLTADEIERVRSSFDRIWATSSRTAELFYSRLFASDVFVRPLFRSDMEEQKRKFISTLAVVVASLDDRADLESLAERLALQHVEFGVRAEHYPVVGDALLWSLEQGLGAHWTPSVAASWRKAYDLLSNHMIAAAYG